MEIQRGGLTTGAPIYLENYVGTYSFQFDQALGKMVIISDEADPAREDESPLKTKKVFQLKGESEDSLFIQLANINIDSEREVLQFCNKYGLPYSSRKTTDTYTLRDRDTSGAQSNEPLSFENYRHDSITANGFFRCVIVLQNLIRLRELIAMERKELNQDLLEEIFSIMIFFLFFSHEYDYDYDLGQEPLPQNRTIRFQYYFHMSRLKNRDLDVASYLSGLSFALDVGVENFGSIHLANDMKSKTFQNIFAFFRLPIFEENGLRKIECIQYGKVKLNYVEDIASVLSSEDFALIKHLGTDILACVINEGVGHISPSLSEDEEGHLVGSWKMVNLMQALYMELFLSISTNGTWKQCENPKCGRYFEVEKSKKGKKFCCHECAVYVAKLKQRKRERQKIS